MKRLITITLCLCGLQSVAQLANETGIWLGAEAEYRIADDWTVAGELQYRRDENLTRLKKVFAEGMIKYRAAKSLRIGIGYRHSLFPSDIDNNSPSHRYFADVQLRNLDRLFGEKSRWQLSARVRSQVEMRQVERDEVYLRLKVGGSYNIPKTPINPLFSLEMFYAPSLDLVYTSEAVESVGAIDELRYKVGVPIAFNKRTELQLAYIFRQMRFGTNEHLAGFKLNHTFKKKKNKTAE